MELPPADEGLDLGDMLPPPDEGQMLPVSDLPDDDVLGDIFSKHLELAD